MKNGKKTLFWDGIWKGDSSIKSHFPELYRMCTNPRASVADYWDGEDWLIPFRRSLTTSERGCLEELHSWLCQSPLEAGQDDILWALDKSKAFTTNSLYSFLTNRGVMLKPSVNFWNARIPLKIKIFLWQVDNDRLQSAMTLKYRGWQGSHLCCLCQQPETKNHIVLSKKKQRTTSCSGVPWPDSYGKGLGRP